MEIALVSGTEKSSKELIREIQALVSSREAPRQEDTGAEGAKMPVEERFRDLFEAANDVILMADSRGDIVAINPKAEELTGYTRAELVGKNIFEDLIVAEDLESIKAVLSRLVAGESQIYEVRWRAKDGSIIHFEENSSPRMSKGGEFIHTRCILRDITERKRVENERQLSGRILEIANKCREIEPLFEEIVAEIQRYSGCEAVGIRVLDEEGNIPYQAYTGFSKSFYESESPLSILKNECMCIRVIKGDMDCTLPFFTEGASFYANGMTRFLATLSEQEKGQIRNGCKEAGYESVALVPILLRDGVYGLIHLADARDNMVPLGIVKGLERVAKQLGVAVERILAEEQAREHQRELARAWRINTMGEMASGLAHELNQPLCAILNYAGVCRRMVEAGVDESGNLSDTIEQIACQAERAGKIIRRIRGMVARRQPSESSVDVNGVVGEVYEMMKAEAGEMGISMRTELGDDLPLVLADNVEIEEVVLNLVRNAFDAVGDVSPERRQVIIRTCVAQNNAVEVCVSDSGIGLPPENTDTVFDSFFTTKEDGLGIGLSVSRKIVEAHGGRLWAEANHDYGASFRFRLPVKGANSEDREKREC